MREPRILWASLSLQVIWKNTACPSCHLGISWTSNKETYGETLKYKCFLIWFSDLYISPKWDTQDNPLECEEKSIIQTFIYISFYFKRRKNRHINNSSCRQFINKFSDIKNECSKDVYWLGTWPKKFEDHKSLQQK